MEVINIYSVKACFRFQNDSIVPPCGCTVIIFNYGWPQTAMNPKLWKHQFHILAIKQCTLHFPLIALMFISWLIASICYGQTWRTCQVLDLRLWLPVFDSHFHKDPPHKNSAGNNLNFFHKEEKKQHSFFPGSRSDYTFATGLTLCQVWRNLLH